MSPSNEGTRRGERRVSLTVHSRRWSAATTPRIIADPQAAQRLGMSIRRFYAVAKRHNLSKMRDGQGQLFRSIAEIEELAESLGIPVQLQLDLAGGGDS